MTSNQLARLVSRARNGSYEAFSWICSEEFDSLYYFMRKMAGNEEAARKAAEEVLLRLHGNLDHICDSGALRAFVNRAAYEKGRGFPCRGGAMRDAALPERFNLLAQDQKALLLLHCYKRLSIRQTAESMAISENETLRRLARAGTALGIETSEWGGTAGELWFPTLSRALCDEAASMSMLRQKVRVWDSISRALECSGLTAAATKVMTVGAAALKTGVVRNGVVAALALALMLRLAMVPGLLLPERALSQIGDSPVPMAESPVSQGESSDDRLIAASDILYFPAGAALTPEEVLELAGPTLSDAGGGDVSFEVLLPAEALAGMPGDYTARIRTVGRSPALETEIWIIIGDESLTKKEEGV